MASDTSDIDISLRLGPSLAPTLAAEPTRYDPLRDALRDGVDQLSSSLGIPGEVRVTLEPAPDGNKALPSVSANGVACHAPGELFLWTYHYARGLHEGVQSTIDDVVLNPDTDFEMIVEFLTLTCLEILKAQPSVLLGARQAAAYLASLASVDGTSVSIARPEDLEANRRLLATVLDLRISLADTDKVAAVLDRESQRPRCDVAEALIKVLSRDTVEVQIGTKHLRQITNADPENTRNVFPFLREGMFNQSGLSYPKFKFVPSEDVKPGAFRFKINDLATLPLLGLTPDQCLVNDTQERLNAQSLHAMATMNSASGQPGSLIPAAERAVADSKSLTTWGNLDYLVLAFAEALRRSARCFVHVASVERWLQRLHGERGTASLVDAVKARVTIEELTRILRALAAEGLSIRNARAILESVLDCPAPRDQAGNRATDADAVAFVRARLKYQIRHKYAQGTNTVSVYIFDPAIERLLVSESISEAQQDLIRSAIWSELASVPPTAVLPLLLTTSTARPRLLQIARPAFPRVNLVSYDDLPGDTTVEALARISLPNAPGGVDAPSE